MKKEFIYELIENVDNGIYLVDKDRKITYWNKGAEKITGYTEAEIIGKRCSNDILVHIDEGGVNQCGGGTCPLFDVLNGGNKFDRELYLHHKNGYRIPVSVKVIPMSDKNGEIIGAVEIFSDRSNRIENIDDINELKKLILFDSLTESGNRRFVEMNLFTRFAELNRYNIPFGVLFMDIDDFKAINDKHGHDVGDKVLTMVSKTLGKNLRGFDIVGRWGGEEFIAVIININAEQLGRIAEKLKLLIQRSLLVIDSEIIGVTISIGATLAKKEDSHESLLKRADKLMYESKGKGKNIVTLG